MMLNDHLAERLTECMVRIDVRDTNTAILWEVPTNERCFSKPKSNLLVKRPAQGLQYLICVDEDLEYTGSDPALLKAFASGQRRAGWRTIFTSDSSAGFQSAVENALRVLGFDGAEPKLIPGNTAMISSESGLLGAFGRDLSGWDNHLSVGFSEYIDEATSALLRWGDPRLVLLVGPSGIGKTFLLRGVSHKLKEREPERKMVAIDTASLFGGTLFQSDRENLLSAILKEALKFPLTTLAFEACELIRSETAYGPQMLARALESGVRFAGTTLPSYLHLLQASCLRRWLHIVPVSELSCEETLSVLRRLSESIADHHSIEIDEGCLRSCVRAADDLPGCFPSKAIDLLVSAAARAEVAGSDILGQDDILVAVRHCQITQT